MADEHEHGVLGRLLQRLQEGVGGVAAHRLGLADQVRPPRRLERPQVQVAAQLPDLVDQDRLALRLDDEQVGVLLDLDPVLVGGEQRRDERVRRVVLAGAPRAVQQVRVPRRLGCQPSRRAASGWPRTAHAPTPPRPGRPTVATSPPPSTSVTRPGSRRGESANASATAARNRSPSTSIRSAASASRGVSTRTMVRSGSRPSVANRLTSRIVSSPRPARRPGTRPTSRGSGRRPPRRRAPAPGGSRRPRAAPGWPRTAAPRRAGVTSQSPWSSTSDRTRSPSAVPPGSRHSTTSWPAARRRSPGGGPASTCRRRRVLRGSRTSPQTLRATEGPKGTVRRRTGTCRIRGSVSAPRPGCGSLKGGRPIRLESAHGVLVRAVHPSRHGRVPRGPQRRVLARPRRWCSPSGDRTGGIAVVATLWGTGRRS